MDEYPMSRESWIDVEDEFLRENYHRLGGYETALRLGRSLSAVRIRAQTIGVARRRKPSKPKRPMSDIRRDQERRAKQYLALRARTGLSWSGVAAKLGVTRSSVIGTVWRYLNRTSNRRSNPGEHDR